MRRNWKEIPRDDSRAHWAGIYVTLNRKGTIVMNRIAYERMGDPAAFLILYDSANNTIGLKPTGRQIANAFPAAKSGRHGGRKVAAYRLLVEAGLHVDDTWNFPTPRSTTTKHSY